MLLPNQTKRIAKPAILLFILITNAGVVLSQKNKKKVPEISLPSKSELTIYPLNTLRNLGNNLSEVILKSSYNHQLYEVNEEISKNKLIAANRKGTLGIYLNENSAKIADLRDGYILQIIGIKPAYINSITFSFSNNDSAVFFFTGINFQEYNFYSGQTTSYFNWPEDQPCQGYEQIGDNIYFWYQPSPYGDITFYRLHLPSKNLTKFKKEFQKYQVGAYNRYYFQESVTFLNNLYRKEKKCDFTELATLDFIRILCATQQRKLFQDINPIARKKNVFATQHTSGIELIKFDLQSDSFSLIGKIQSFRQLPNGEISGSYFTDEEIVGLSNEMLLTRAYHKLIIYQVDDATVKKNINSNLDIIYLNTKQLNGGSNSNRNSFLKAYLNENGNKVIFDYSGYYEDFCHHWIYSLEKAANDTFTNKNAESELVKELTALYNDKFDFQSLQKTKLETDLEYNARVQSALKIYKRKYYNILDSLSKKAYPNKITILDFPKNTVLQLNNYDSENELLRIPILSPDGKFYSVIHTLSLSDAKKLFQQTTSVSTKIYFFYNYLSQQIEPFKLSLESDSLRWNLFFKTQSYILAKNNHLINQNTFENCVGNYFNTTNNRIHFLDTNVFFNWISPGKPKKYMYSTGAGSFKINIVDANNRNYEINKTVFSKNGVCPDPAFLMDCRDMICVDGACLWIGSDAKIYIDSEFTKANVNLPSNISAGIYIDKNKRKVYMQISNLNDNTKTRSIEINQYFQITPGEQISVPTFSFSPNGKYVCMEIGKRLVIFQSGSLQKIFEMRLKNSSKFVWDAHSRYLSVGTNELDHWIIPIENADY